MRNPFIFSRCCTWRVHAGTAGFSTCKYLLLGGSGKMDQSQIFAALLPVQMRETRPCRNALNIRDSGTEGELDREMSSFYSLRHGGSATRWHLRHLLCPKSRRAFPHTTATFYKLHSPGSALAGGYAPSPALRNDAEEDLRHHLLPPQLKVGKKRDLDPTF